MKFSIIVPVYNVGPYIRECLESVKTQSYENWEVVCVDDGSTDDSGNILDEYAERDSRFIVFHQANEGVSVARNRALERSSGEWVLFLDGDDALRRDTLSICLDVIKRHPDVGAVQFDYMDSESSASVKEMPFSDFSETFVDLSGGLNNHYLYTSFCCRCYRKRDAEVGFPVGLPIGEDRVFMIRAIDTMPNIIEINLPLYWYRIRSTSVMRSPLTEEKFGANMKYLIQMTMALHALKKNVDCDVWRGIGLQITESMGWLLFSVPTSDRKGAYSRWLDALREVRAVKNYSIWAKLLIRMNSVVRHMSFAYVTCFVPYWLKQHGIHR